MKCPHQKCNAKMPKKARINNMMQKFQKRPHQKSDEKMPASKMKLKNASVQQKAAGYFSSSFK